MMIWHKITAFDGTVIPLFVVNAVGTPEAMCFFMPALGVPAKFYRTFAQGLAQNGITTVVMEQRGNGESPYRPGDGTHFCIKEYLDIDVKTAVQWMQAYVPDKPIYIAGHSMGGHIASYEAARHAAHYAGVIHFTCGMPYAPDFPMPGRLYLMFLVLALPMLTCIVGYFPGKKLGFAGREYSGLMRDWREWVKHGRYDITQHIGSEAQMNGYQGRILSIAIDQDSLMTSAAINRVCGYFTNAKITHRLLTKTEQGEHLGHINWAKKPDGAVSAVLDWMRSKD